MRNGRHSQRPGNCTLRPAARTCQMEQFCLFASSYLQGALPQHCYGGDGSICKYSLYLANKFLCTLTHNSPRCSLLRNGAQTDRRNASSPLCFPWRSLPSPSRPKLRLSAQLTHQYREGPRPFSGLIGQHAHGWRQLELPPLNHQLLAAFAALPIRAVHEAAMQQNGSTGRRHHSHTRPATRSASPRTAQHLQYRARRPLQRTG